MAEQQTNEIILLVGGNPLPNYVAALALRAELVTARGVHLLYTKEVQDIKDNLCTCLRDAGFHCRATYITDAGDAAAIRDACADIQEGTHLHYTGGTNAMAVHVHAAWTKRGGQPNQASYLFGRDDRLMTDAGVPMAIPASIKLDLTTLTALHGPRAAHTPRMVGPDLPNDAEAIASCVFGNPELAKQIYDAVPSRTSDFRTHPFQPTHPLTLSENCIPAGGWPHDKVEGWQKFLRGEWLDRWVYQKIQDTGLVPPGFLYADVRRRIRGREFQLDVVAVRGHHLYVVSCTTSQWLDRCKAKLFEVSMRARQLGGDLARSALVCLAYEDEQHTDLVDELEKDVRSLSESTRVPKVFGLHHVREWAGYGRACPDLSSLKAWLES